MNNVLQNLIPPLIYTRLESFKKNNVHRTFASYENELKSCTEDSYEHRELVEVILKKRSGLPKMLHPKQPLSSKQRLIVWFQS